MDLVQMILVNYWIGITTDGYSGYNYGNKRQFLVSGGDGASMDEIGAGGTSVNWYSGINKRAFFAYNTTNKLLIIIMKPQWYLTIQMETQLKILDQFL